MLVGRAIEQGHELLKHISAGQNKICSDIVFPDRTKSQQHFWPLNMSLYIRFPLPMSTWQENLVSLGIPHDISPPSTWHLGCCGCLSWFALVWDGLPLVLRCLWTSTDTKAWALRSKVFFRAALRVRRTWAGQKRYPINLLVKGNMNKNIQKHTKPWLLGLFFWPTAKSSQVVIFGSQKHNFLSCTGILFLLDIILWDMISVCLFLFGGYGSKQFCYAHFQLKQNFRFDLIKPPQNSKSPNRKSLHCRKTETNNISQKPKNPVDENMTPTGLSNALHEGPPPF